MIELNLGVVQQQYTNGTTTGDVAEILENKYGIMGAFADLKMSMIQRELAEDWLEQFLNTGTVDFTSAPQAMQNIQDAFIKFIEQRQVERIGLPGVPTQAALKGINHRLLKPYAKGNPRRPSFLDAGLFLSSFRPWLTEGK